MAGVGKKFVYDGEIVSAAMEKLSLRPHVRAVSRCDVCPIPTGPRDRDVFSIGTWLYQSYMESV